MVILLFVPKIVLVGKYTIEYSQSLFIMNMK